jgi:hypothetical protein
MSVRGAATGTWKVIDCRDLNGAYWIEVDHRQQGKFSIAEVRNGCEEADEVCSVEANAALIAAAPELLAALKWCVEWDGECLGDNPVELNRAKAAIRKATKP